MSGFYLENPAHRELHWSPMQAHGKISAVVVGANGYSGEELVRLLRGHERVRLAAITSRRHAGRPLDEVFPRFARLPGTALVFDAPDATRLAEMDADFFFLALPHGVASEFAVPLIEAGKRVIDISADFRLRDAGTYTEFYGAEHPAAHLLPEAVYGLPEFFSDQIAPAQLVAAPGCYPTSILLPLLPLVADGLIDPSRICVSSASGTSGAGRKAEEAYLFAECNESLRAYGLPKHRHLSEIEQELTAVSGRPVVITFVPHLAPMTRGMHTTIFVEPAEGIREKQLVEAWRTAYEHAPFVRLGGALPDTKNVAGTNFCDMALRMDSRTGRAVLLSAIDNLVKGAGGQAVQCMNLMAGLPEEAGLL